MDGVWRTSSISSFSSGTGASAAALRSDVRWRKSSFSGRQADCVEVAEGFRGLRPIRDSKDPSGPALVFTAAAWSSFVAALRLRELPLG